jgi:segregation and condensation protein A
MHQTTHAPVFSLALPSYEGPFELILELVEKRKLFINDVALATITEEYINFVATHAQDVSLDDRTRFVSVATTLLLIKSRSLLPGIELSSQEASDIRTLEDRVSLYGLLQDRVGNVADLWGGQTSFVRPYVRKKNVVMFAPDARITPELLYILATNIEKTIPRLVQKRTEVVLEKVMSLQEMLHTLENRIRRAAQGSFHALVGHGSATTDRGRRVHVIVGFLAILELARKGVVRLAQDDVFGDIVLSKQEE